MKNLEEKNDEQRNELVGFFTRPAMKRRARFSRFFIEFNEWEAGVKRRDFAVQSYYDWKLSIFFP